MLKDLKERQKELVTLVFVVLLSSFSINIIASYLLITSKNLLPLFLYAIFVLLLACAYYYFFFIKPEKFEDGFETSVVIFTGGDKPQVPINIFNNKRRHDFWNALFFQKIIEKSKTPWQSENKSKEILDVVEMSVLYLYSHHHAFNWLRYRRIQGINTTSDLYKKKDSNKIDFNKIEELKDNLAYDEKLFDNLSPVAPPHTKLKITHREHSRDIVFENNNLVFKITISFHTWIIGNRLERVNDLTSFEQMQKNYSTYGFIINVEILPKQRVLFNSEGIDYYTWAENFWSLLKQELNDVNYFKN